MIPIRKTRKEENGDTYFGGVVSIAVNDWALYALDDAGRIWRRDFDTEDRWGNRFRLIDGPYDEDLSKEKNT